MVRESKTSWLAAIIVVLTLLVLIGFFYLWLQPQGAMPSTSKSRASSSTAVVISTQSVPDFAVGPGVSQNGTLEGKISGRCGNIAWQDLSPKELAQLRKLCPKEAPAAR